MTSAAGPNATILEGVGQTVLVLSGKGGVGKSTVTVQLASALRAAGHSVGVLDIDLCGPSIPRMLGLEGRDVLTTPQSVISLAFFLDSKSDAVIWRGPKKNAMIKQLLTSIMWNVDYLIIDTPPGTSDEHISVMENLRSAAVLGAVVVTTPQMMAVGDVARELTFCRRTGINILGVLENMAGFVCPNCSECSNILATGGGEQLAVKAGVQFLGRVPIDPMLALCSEKGENYLVKCSSSPAAATFQALVTTLTSQSDNQMEVEK
ncbi:hypothetical protein Pcinc_003762 [Petrolisthes cinctipes]|uniref:Cytosolic Fe-S cluster assembly factor NUBP2 homolog n=1 Tax=Petrolisthes cinctipes TaxID=88211 RepID=A0AAE1GH71_PETCI|nr:hypothetical protein Pcinc_003762 [Petrolisthes cinctipes]